MPGREQLGEEEVLEEAASRALGVLPSSDGREELLDAVDRELRMAYGNVNTLYIHAEQLVRTASHTPSRVKSERRTQAWHAPIQAGLELPTP